jgi:hypothetical protein
MAFKRIGGLWIKESKNGQKFMSGNIEIGKSKLNISVFKNDKSENPNRPAYSISVDEEKLAEFQRNLKPDVTYSMPDAGDDGLPF